LGLKEEIASLFRKKEKAPSPQEEIGRLGLKILSDKKLDERTRLVNMLHEEFDKPVDEVLKVLKKGEEATPLDYVKVLRDRLQVMNRLMKIVSVPYGRAGRNEAFREALQAWEILYGLTVDMIDTVENVIKSAMQEQQEERTVEATVLTETELASRIERMISKVKSGEKVETQTLLEELTSETENVTLLTLKINIGELLRKLESFMKVEVYPFGFMIMNSSYFPEDVAPAYATVIQEYVTGPSPYSPPSPDKKPLGE